jgi:hypothetical protein
MGYEVIFYYKSKDKETGTYKEEESNNFKKRVGDPYEDTPIEKLASVIMKQLARRDVWVEDIEIYEITKKKISFKETKNGIIIKNKKIILDDNFEIDIKQESNETESVGSAPSLVEIPLQQKNETGIVKGTTRVLRRMLFAPEPQQQINLLKQGVKLTPDKIYEIYKIEKGLNGISEIYLLLDDNNHEKKVADDCFVPATNLSQEDEELNDGLNWGGVIKGSLPSVR